MTKILAYLLAAMRQAKLRPHRPSAARIRRGVRPLAQESAAWAYASQGRSPLDWFLLGLGLAPKRAPAYVPVRPAQRAGLRARVGRGGI